MAKKFSEQLLSSVLDRTHSLARHVNMIKFANLNAPESFHDALGLVDFYLESVEKHIDARWRKTRNERDKINVAKEILANLAQKETDIDLLFARGGHSSIPRSLSSRLEQEFQALRLESDLRPVLTVGPPGNFEAPKPDLRGYLFKNLTHSKYWEDPRYASTNFAMISVPYLEGTRAFWEPLVMGHEVGHVKMFYLNNWQYGTQGSPYSDLLLAELALPITDTLRNWLHEFLCDLNAYRLYGPSAISSMAEMFLVSPQVARTANPLELSSVDPYETHPPRSTRIELLYALAEELGDQGSSGLFDSIAGAWSQLRNESPTGVSEERAVFLRGFVDAVNILWRHVCEWGPSYPFVKQSQSVQWLANRFRQGIPGGLSSEQPPNGTNEPFSSGDIINAAWAAEESKNDESIPIDNLALKALDNLSVQQLWTRAIVRLRTVGTDHESRLTPKDWSEAAKSRNLAASGPLSGIDLLALLDPLAMNSRFVATPLFPGSIREAGMDVRLSGSFITFKHSATEVFDAVKGGQDPREMSEWVEKGWGERFILHPDELVLAATFEYFVLPADIRGEVASRSSQGRLGLVSVTASKVQPGTMGCITLELVNQGQTPIALTVGERVAQIDFDRLANPVPSVGRPTYRCATGPEFSQIRFDWDHPHLREGQKELAGIPPEVSVFRTLELLQETAVMIDLRGTLEWEEGHAPNARHIPFSDVAASSFLDLEGRSVVILASRSGNRASRAAVQLRRIGIDAFVMMGGMREWTARKLPMEKGAG